MLGTEAHRPVLEPQCAPSPAANHVSAIDPDVRDLLLEISACARLLERSVGGAFTTDASLGLARRTLGTMINRADTLARVL